MKVLALLILVFSEINCLHIFNASGEAVNVTVKIGRYSRKGKYILLPNNTHIHHNYSIIRPTFFFFNGPLHPNFKYKLIKVNGKVEASEMD